MIKNLNDLLSVLFLIFVTIYSARLFVWAFIIKDDYEDTSKGKWQLIKDYNDNVEE